jgi:HAD superfamily hydrolase (TIGR01509 family)
VPSSSPSGRRRRRHRLPEAIGFRPDAVIFDMDGVLADTEPLNQRALEAVLGLRGARLSAEELAALIGLSNDATWRGIVDRFALAETPRALEDEYVRALAPIVASDAVPGPGVSELVGALAADGIGLAIASSSPRAAVDAVLAALELDEAFAVVVSDELVARGKPAPDIFLLAARELGVDPGRCVVIEDSLHGLEAARAAGMTSIGVRTRYNAAWTLDAQLVVDSLEELLSI